VTNKASRQLVRIVIRRAVIELKRACGQPRFDDNTRHCKRVVQPPLRLNPHPSKTEGRAARKIQCVRRTGVEGCATRLPHLRKLCP
jgi:hypothetical protein